MKYKGYHDICIFLLFGLFTFLLFFPANALAAQDGSGGGGGPAIPLFMDWSLPGNGQKNVGLQPIIQCKYSHNVAQHTVKDRNISLLSLQKKDGAIIPAQIFTADAQIEFDKRQYIYLTPREPLDEFTEYKVVSKQGVQAKNGMATEEDQIFSFTTGSKNSQPMANMVLPQILAEKNQAKQPSAAAENKKQQQISAKSLAEVDKDFGAEVGKMEENQKTEPSDAVKKEDAKDLSPKNDSEDIQKELAQKEIAAQESFQTIDGNSKAENQQPIFSQAIIIAIILSVLVLSMTVSFFWRRHNS
ncbi:MAG: Ig-like domain-containing protein [Clostridiales bacterium]